MCQRRNCMFIVWTIIAALGTVCTDSILQKYIQLCGVENCPLFLCRSQDHNQTSFTAIGNQIVDDDNYNDNKPIIDVMCCGECSCDSGCFKRGDCCPDMLSSNASQYPPGGVYVCMDTLDNASKNRNVSRSYYTVIGRCPITYNDSIVVSKCQLLSDEDDYKANVPVFSPFSLDLYRNIYCALCNNENVKIMQPWKLTSKCATEEIISSFKNVNCTDHVEVWIPPFKSVQEVCIPVYDRCNVTGWWEEYDEEIEIACKSFKSIYQNIYQNIFCYICNVKLETERRVVLSGSTVVLPPLSILFQFQEGDQHTGNQLPHSTCSEGFVFDQFKDTCRQILCLDGFHFDNDTTDCVPEDSLCARVIINFVYEDTAKLPINTMKCSLENLLKQTVAFNVLWSSKINIFIDELFISKIIFAFKSTFLYDLSIVDSLLEYQDRTVNVNSQKLDGSNITHTFTVNIDVDSEFTDFPTNGFDCVHFKSDNIDSVKNESSNVQISLCGENNYVRVSYLIHCPVVALNMTDYNVTVTADGLYITDVGLYLKSYQYANKSSNGDIIYVCTTDYIVNAKDTVDIDTSEVDIIMSYLTLVCSAVSIVCSMFTFITYAIFPSLRSQPGINNMVLCITVFLGHLLFVTGINQDGFEEFCVAIGVALHFLWMFIVVWMSVCCFHMFRVFRSSLSISRDDHKFRTTVLYVLVACLLSLLPVLTNIIYSLTITHGKHIGYGPQICWISYPTSVGYTMSLPALLLVIINIILFTFVILSIRQIPNVQSTIQNRQFMTIYLKLSTLTGAIWLTVIPTIFTDFKVFGYIFTILCANQGLFIMLAFICNKKTLTLYKDVCYRSSKHDQGMQNSTNLTNGPIGEQNTTPLVSNATSVTNDNKVVVIENDPLQI